MMNIQLVLETFESISSCTVREVYVWMKEVTSLIHMHSMQVAAVDPRKIVFASFGIVPSQSCMCKVYCSLVD